MAKGNTTHKRWNKAQKVANREWIIGLLKQGITCAKIVPLAQQKGISKDHVYRVAKQAGIKPDNPIVVSAHPVSNDQDTAAFPTESERLPETQEEHGDFCDRHNSWQAKALRILDIERRLQRESGIAYVQLTEKLETLLKEGATHRDRVEHITTLVYPEGEEGIK